MNLFESILSKAKTNFANPDPTQNLQFKAVQGAANLYTGVAEEAAMGGQREFERRKEIAKQFLSSKGYAPDVIENTLSQIEYKPNFIGRVREGLGNRMLETARTTETLSNVENPLQRLGVGTLAYGGDVVATAMEPVASAVSPFVQAGIEKAGLAPTVQNLGQQFQGFKERNPLTGEAIEGMANLSQLAPVPLVKPAGEMITQGGKAIVRGAEAVAPRIKAIPTAIKRAPGVVDDAIESGVEKLANKALGSSDGSAELFKATSPSYNLLAKRKDIGKVKQQAKLADEAVVEAGFIPKTTTERVDAYKATMKKLWDDVQNARGGVQEKYKSSSISDTIRSEVDRMKVNGKIPPSLESDVSALLREADFYDSLGDVSLPDLGIIRSNINAKLTFGDKTQFSDAYNAVMQKVISAIREGEDAVLTKNAGQATSGMLAKYGALRNMLDDIVKQDIKASRAKGLPIEESFGRISGLAEMAGGVGQLVMNPKQAIPTMLSGGSKVLLGKVAGKMKDADYLIRTGYEKLLKSKNSTNGNTPGNTPVVRPNSNRPTGKQKIVKPSPQVKPVEKKVYNSNLTESELKDATKGAKTMQEYNKMEMEASMKKINSQNEKLYKGKTISYERDGKSYNIEFDKNPDTFILAKEMVDDIKMPYKIKEFTPKNIKPVEKTSATQATGPRVIGKMGKVETKTTLKSPTSYEEGMRRPFTMGNNKPIVKRASDIEITPVKKLNTGEEITLVRGTGGKGSGAGEAIRGKGLYLTDNVDVAKHYGPELKTVTLKNSDILDGGETLKNSKQIISTLPKEMRAYLDDNFEYSYNSLIKTIEGNTGIEAEVIAEALNNAIKGKYKGVKFEIGLVNDSLADRGLGNKNAFVIFDQPKPLSPQKTVKPLAESKQSMGNMETKKLIEEKRNTEYKKRVDNLIDLAKKHYENASGYNKYMKMNDGKKQFLSDLESNSGIEFSKSTDEGIKKIGLDPDKTVYIHSFYPKYVKGTGIAKDDFLSKMKEAMSYKLRPNKYFATSSFSEDGANFFDRLVREGYLKRVTDTVSQYDEFPSFGIPDPVKKYKTGISSGMNVFELTDKILSYERKIDKEKLFEEAVRGKVGKPSIYKMFGIK